MEVTAYHKDKKAIFRLPSEITLLGFKQKLFHRFNVRPHEQILHGLSILEDTDLLFSTECRPTNVLLVSTHDAYQSYAESLTTLLFLNKTRVPIAVRTLKNAIENATETRKVLLLYLNAGGTDAFYDFLIESGTSLVQYCEVVCWDISDEICHAHLKKILKLYVLEDDEQLLNKLFSSKQSSLLMLTPSKTLNLFFTCIHSQSLNITNFVLQFELAESTLQSDYKKTVFLENPANAYQQTMLSNLGNRDYDCYEPDEHEHLKTKIGYAFFGPPQSEGGYEPKENALVEKALEKILKHNDKFSKWRGKVFMRVIYNVSVPLPKDVKTNVPASDQMGTYPIFVIRKCKDSRNPCRIYIDHQLRVYNTWRDYLKDIKLHKCIMVLPTDAKYQKNDDGVVTLDRRYSPKCGPGSKLVEVTDITSSVAGIGSSALMALSLIPAITVAPAVIAAATFTGIGVGFYSLIRSAVAITDRAQHDESLSFSNSEARAAYFNVGAGLVGIISMGATARLAKLAARGTAIPKLGVYAVNTVNIANVATSGISLGNGIVDVFQQYLEDGNTPSTLTLVQLSSSLFFFTNSVYNFRTAGVIIDEAHGSSMSNIAKDLKSNKQRKMLNKFVKETIRVTGDTRKGTAEVISTIRKMNDPVETMAILGKSNKIFNKHNIRFSAENGNINLNGVKVDMNQYSSMTGSQKTAYLSELPPMLTATRTGGKTSAGSSSIFSFERDFSNIVINGVKLISNTKTVQELTNRLLQKFEHSVKRKLIDITYQLIQDLIPSNIDLIRMLRDINSKCEPFVQLLEFVLKYFKRTSQQRIEEYNQAKAKAQMLPDYDEAIFDSQYSDDKILNKCIVFFEITVLTFKIASSNMNMLIEFFYSWLFSEVKLLAIKYKKKEVRMNSNTGIISRSKTHCDKCKGYFYC